MGKYAQGTYNVVNTDKYVGNDGNPKYKSSWEKSMMEFLDGNSNILKWGYEVLSIPYMNPLTHKKSNYYPDFLVQYIDKAGTTRVDLIEVKPSSQVTLENARTKKDQLSVILNTAKWEAAMAYSKMQGMSFRVIDESQIFHTQKKRVKSPRIPRKKR